MSTTTPEQGTQRRGRGWPWQTALEKIRTPQYPDPWILRKAVVVIVLCIAVWDFYVGVGRVCVPAIRHHKNAAYSRTEGIGILVTFIVLWIMFIWSYTAIILTPPGYARDVVPVSPPPSTITDSDSMLNARVVDPPSVSTPAGSPIVSSPGSSGTQQSDPSSENTDGTLSTPTPPAAVLPKGELKEFPYVGRPVPPVYTEPRWCRVCQIIKPDRTHHCRHCGTCVLQFDHHCVWIGRCVGWRNHAVFITFNIWAGIFCLFNTVVFIIDLAKSTIDPEKIVLVVISGFLAVFTLGAMLPTHISLILKGRTTLESFATQTQERVEEIHLKRVFDSRCPVREIRRARKHWDAEYGGVEVNDRWAFGRPKDRWRQEMGKNVFGWILPIGRPLGNGIEFTANPRFGPNGEWLRMQDWPKVIAVKP